MSEILDLSSIDLEQVSDEEPFEDQTEGKLHGPKRTENNKGALGVNPDWVITWVPFDLSPEDSRMLLDCSNAAGKKKAEYLKDLLRETFEARREEMAALALTTPTARVASANPRGPRTTPEDRERRLQENYRRSQERMENARQAAQLLFQQSQVQQ